MRLTRVQVTGLFGLFDHEIRLNSDERITIIHGPNGFGKTLVLRMVEGLISGEYSPFFEVPFKVFSLETDTGLRLTVECGDRLGPDEDKLLFQHIYVGSRHPGVGAPAYWLKFRAQERHSLYIYQAISSATFKSDLDGFVRNKVETASSEPDWLSKARAEFPKANLVRTQRLNPMRRKQSKPTVEVYSQELADHMQQKLAEYAARSQELDRTFPVRLLNRPKTDALTAENLRERLDALEQMRMGLTRLGFLEPEQETDLGKTSVQAIEMKRDVLSVYVEDMGSKLAIFDELASKIQVFTRIINERFLLKSLAIHREQGFVFTSATGTRLKPSELSSGEQHELILFYELLFQMKKNELLLIDEPEISLHVAWQEKFLGDLSEVVKLSEIDVVIATHSPEIIGDHWNLTVELKGPPEAHKG